VTHWFLVDVHTVQVKNTASTIFTHEAMQSKCNFSQNVSKAVNISTREISDGMDLPRVTPRRMVVIGSSSHVLHGLSY
jgi:hypothetical protein